MKTTQAMTNAKKQVIFLLITCCAWGMARTLPASQAAGPESGALRYSALTLTNAVNETLPLFSHRAYQAEFRYLRRVLGELDLHQPGVKTDGWRANIAEAEWPWMSCAYFGYGCVNLAKADREFRSQALDEARWLLEAMQTPRLSGFVVDHFGEPFGTNLVRPAVFVHGHWLQLAVRYRAESQDQRFDALIHRVARLLSDGFARSDQGLLKSYQDMWWISDNLPALSALRKYDALFRGRQSAVVPTFLDNAKKHYLDAKTGLLATYVDAPAKRILQGPRGISTMYGLHFLKDLEAGWGQQQYGLAKRHFLRTVLGITGMREFPEGVTEAADIDSGPLIFGLGPSASGFAVAACATMEDQDTAWELLHASVMVGLPAWEHDELHYLVMPLVGQAVIFYGKTCLLVPQR